MIDFHNHFMYINAWYQLPIVSLKKNPLNLENLEGEKEMKLFSKSVLFVAAFLFLFGCAAQQMNNLPPFEAAKFDKNLYTSKVDNFLIVFDASSSMHDKYNGTRKFDIAQALVQRMNQTIPELGQTAGLRSFGHSPAVSSKPTELIYGMEKYSSKTLAGKFKKVTEAGGITPMFTAINTAGTDLKGLSGKMNAVIIIGDGLGNDGDSLGAAKELKKVYGDSICFYPILVGDSAEGDTLFKEIAKIGGCGFASKADELLTSAGMAAFVEKKTCSCRRPCCCKAESRHGWRRGL